MAKRKMLYMAMVEIDEGKGAPAITTVINREVLEGHWGHCRAASVNTAEYAVILGDGETHDEMANCTLMPMYTDRDGVRQPASRDEVHPIYLG